MIAGVSGSSTAMATSICLSTERLRGYSDVMPVGETLLGRVYNIRCKWLPFDGRVPHAVSVQINIDGRIRYSLVYVDCGMSVMAVFEEAWWIMPLLREAATEMAIVDLEHWDHGSRDLDKTGLMDRETSSVPTRQRVPCV
jgi:hypothetical protein